MPLNSRQLAFVRETVGGKTLVDAYVAAYPGVTREAARSAAPRLMKHPGVSEEIARLRAGVRQNTVLSFEAKREFLSEIIKKQPADAPKVADQLRAVEIDNRMSGDNFADRDQNTGNSFHFILNLSKIEAAQNELADGAQTIDVTMEDGEKPALEMGLLTVS